MQESYATSAILKRKQKKDRKVKNADKRKKLILSVENNRKCSQKGSKYYGYNQSTESSLL